MFGFLGRLAVNHPWKVCAAWLLVAVTLSALAPSWSAQSQDDDVRFLPAKYASVRGHRVLEQAFPKDVAASRVIFAIERANKPLTEADFALVDKLAAEAERLDKGDTRITGVCSYADPLVGRRLVSADRRCTLLQVSLSTPFMAVQTRFAVEELEAALRAKLAEAGSDVPTMTTTGPAGVGRDLVKASAESIDRTTLATVILVVVVLLVIYRSPLLAFVPLVTIGVAVWVTLSVLSLVTLIPGVALVNVSQVFAIVILFGAGTDYCLFLISRYREELDSGELPRVALHRGVRSVGGALMASAATVVVGLGMMGFAEFGKVRCAGPVIALGLVVAVFAALTLTPAILQLLGRGAFWPFRISVSLGGRDREGVWGSISRFVCGRPVLVWVSALLLLLPLAALGLCVRPSFKPTGDLSPTSPSVAGLDAIQRHFPAGETGPITLLLTAKTDWSSPAGKAVIHQLSRGFGMLENVAEVRSLTQPLGVPLADATPPPAEKPAKFKGWGGLLAAVKSKVDGAVGQWSADAATAHYASKVDGPDGPRFVTRIDVCPRTDPFAADSIRTLEVLELWMSQIIPLRPLPNDELRADYHGVTVHSRDMSKVIEADRMRVNLLVLAGVFIILLVLVRRWWLSGYLLATVLLSYYATLGATAVFASVLWGKPFGEIEWRVPFFLFTILVAVGEDYNILMVTRVMQERKRRGVLEGLRRGLARTGGTVTACGLIMAGTFGTLMLAELGTLVQVGFALGFGVLLDTFVVRALLVPAFMQLVWQDQGEALEPPVPEGPANILPFRPVGFGRRVG